MICPKKGTDLFHSFFDFLVFETNKKKEKQRGDKKNKDKVDSINDPVRLLQSAAKKFQVTSLYRHLDKYG